MLAPWVKSYDQPRQHIKKQSYHFADKSPYNQSYAFSSSHVRMWELNHKESWLVKNQCFRVEPYGKLSTEQSMFSNRGVGEDSWESLGQQGDQTSQP